MGRLLSKTHSRVIMNCCGKFFAFLFVVVFLAFLVMFPALSVNADSSEPLSFSSGLSLYSPVNSTYSSKVVECNGTFVGPINYELTMNYSVDGKYQGYLPYVLNQNATNSVTYMVNWSFQLPELSKGSHQLSIGIEQQLFTNGFTAVKQDTYVDTVYFTVSPSQPILSVSEVILLAISFLIVAMLAVAMYLRHRKITSHPTTFSDPSASESPQKN